MTEILVHVDPEHELEDHDRGLVRPLDTRPPSGPEGLGFAGLNVGLFTIIGCGPSGATAGASAGASTAGTAAVGASCAVIPEETAGPFQSDESNGPDVLADSGVVRKDIRSSFGSSTTVATGVPLTINLTIQDSGAGCAPLAGAAVYVWHCDQGGGPGPDGGADGARRGVGLTKRSARVHHRRHAHRSDDARRLAGRPPDLRRGHRDRRRDPRA